MSLRIESPIPPAPEAKPVKLPAPVTATRPPAPPTPATPPSDTVTLSPRAQALSAAGTDQL